MGTHYQVLHTHPAATQAEILEAYQRQRARVLAEAGDPDAQLHELDTAYAVLSDPAHRAAYDREIGLGSSALAVSGPPVIHEPVIIHPHIQSACPHCGAMNPSQATVCGACRKQISRLCPNCSQMVTLGEPVCPRCETYLPDLDARRMAEALKTEDSVQGERQAAAVRVHDLESEHKTNAAYGVVFWLVVTLLCIGAAAAAVFVYNMLAGG